MRQISTLILIAVFVSLLGSCVTQKKKGEMSGFGKFYHNTTAKFNGYFNANELMEASIEQLDLQHQDNFKDILSVYEYVDVDNPDAVAADLDKAMEKVSVVVNLHRESVWTDDCYLLLGKAQYLKQDYGSAEETLRFMVDEFSPEKMAEREKESKGKSGKGSKSAKKGTDKEEEVDITQLSDKEKRRLEKDQEKERKRYNRELKKKRKKEQKQRKKSRKKGRKASTAREEEKKKESPSEETDSSEKPVSSEEEKKPSKEDDKADEGDKESKDPAQQPDNYFLKHRPAYQEGVLWLARTYVQRENYDEALRLVQKLENDPKTFEDIRGSLALVKAHLYLEQEKYDLALPELEEAIATTGNRKEKVRYSFIIAQLYQRAGRKGEAYAAFQQALKYGPEYVMEFNGRLLIVENGWRSGTFSVAEAKENLNRMLKDIKNEEYKDQIYYSLAEIDLESGDRKEGIKNLERSLAFSLQNSRQKTESYLRLANLYLEEEDFVPAQAYFDSTLAVMSSADERYSEIKRWRDNLTDISENLQIIAYQDSLLRIAELPESQQRELAYQIKKQRTEERLRQIANSAGAGSGPAERPVGASVAIGAAPPSNPGTGQSSFFAYDDRGIRRGKREFFRKWGDRRLEDDWRRSNKGGAGIIAMDAPEERPSGVVLPDEELAEILAEVPKTEADRLQAQIKIQEAMYKLGTLYRDRLDNNEKSVEVLEALNERFDRSSFQLDSWYYLYLAYSDLKRPQQAKVYADKILQTYPTSTYAKVLKNPNYMAELAEEENRLNRYYNEAYAAFVSGNYQQAYQKSLQAPENFGLQNPLQPKFALLGAMSTGNLQGREAYIGALKDLIARYPDTEEQKRARELLRLLGEKTAGLPGVVQETQTQFKQTDDQLHYILIAFNEDIGLNDSKVTVSNFNLKYHKLDKLRISNIYLGTEAETRIPILVIRRFQNKQEAMAYYQSVLQNKAEFIDESIDHEVFAVSQNNYREILRSKSLEGYRDFFLQNYQQ